jgi:hypothetical protein
LNDHVIDKYTTNASVLATMGRIYEHRKKYKSELSGYSRAWEAITAMANDFRAVVPHTLPSSHQQLWTLLGKMKIYGAKGLISGHFGQTTALKVSDEIERFICALFADCVSKPTKKETARRYQAFLNGEIAVINNATGEVYCKDEFPELSISTIVNYLSKWRNEIATYGRRSGNRQVFMADFTPYHSMKVDMAGSIISADDRQPPFEYSHGKRLWFYNAIDLGSEAFTCWVHGKTKEGIIIEFYRQLARNYAQWGINLPAELEAELNLNSQFKDGLLKAGNMFEHVHIAPNQARAKKIERYFGKLRYEFEKQREGWLARPHALSEANQAGPKAAPILPYNQIVKDCLKDIEDWNNSEHSRIKGKSRWQVFMENQNPNVKPTNWRGIIPYLGFESRTSCGSNGIIRFNGGEYLLGIDGKIAAGEELTNLMDMAADRDIIVKWLDGNDGTIIKAYAYDMQGNFLCIVR